MSDEVLAAIREVAVAAREELIERLSAAVPKRATREGMVAAVADQAFHRILTLAGGGETRVDVAQPRALVGQARTIMVAGYACERCGHEWVPRKPSTPTVCPRCKSPYWDQVRR